MIKKMLLSGLLCAMLGGSVFGARQYSEDKMMRMAFEVLGEQSVQKWIESGFFKSKDHLELWVQEYSTQDARSRLLSQLDNKMSSRMKKREAFEIIQGDENVDPLEGQDLTHLIFSSSSQPSVAPRGGKDAVSAVFEVFGGQNMYVYLEGKQGSSFSLKNNNELEWNINKIYELQNNETFINEVKSRMEQSPSQVIVSSPVSSSSSSSAHRAPPRIDRATKPKDVGSSASSSSSSSLGSIASCHYVPGGARYAQVEAKMREQGYSQQAIQRNYGTGGTTAWLPNSISQGGGAATTTSFQDYDLEEIVIE